MRIINTNPSQGALMRFVGVLLFSMLASLYSVKSYAQFAAAYTFSTNTSSSLEEDLNANTFTMGSGTTQLVASGTDQGTSTVQNIGFTFNFMGNNYTQFSATSNGLVALGGTTLSTGRYVIGTPGDTVITPFSADLATHSTGKVHYKLIGTAPNRTLVIEFQNMEISWTSSTADGTYQARLYESTNIIEFVYGPMSVASTFSVGHTGFSNGANSGNFYSVNTSTHTASTSTIIDNAYNTTGAITSLTSSSNGSRRAYIFTPPSVDAGISSIDNPVLPLTPGSKNVIVSLKNYGTSTLTSAKVNWSVNGVLQTPRTVSKSIATGLTDTVNLGSFTFSSATTYIIKSWTTNPNSTTDGFAGNDTITRTYLPPLSGEYTVGVGKDFATLTSAINYMNASGITGAVTFLLTDATYSAAEVFPITIDQVIGGNASRRVTIRPAAGNSATISGSSINAIIKLNGADYITIDGSNTKGGTGRNLTISNTSAASNTAAIWVASLGTGLGAKADSIKNTNISAGSTSVTSAFGIHVGNNGSISTSATGADNDSLTIQNNLITRSYFGIYARGISTTGILDKLVITQNTIGSVSAADYVSFKGIDIAATNAAEISRNTIINMRLTTSVALAGIEIGTNNPNAVITRNYISGIQSSAATNGAYGINVSSATGNTGITIDNNMISDILTSNSSVSSTSTNAFGIRITGGTGFKIYYNSVHLSGVSSVGTSAALSAALMITSSTVTADVRNNTFSNTMGGVTGAKRYAIYLTSASNVSASDYNNYYVSGTYGVLGYLTSDRTTLSAWRTATSKDVNSISVNPKFFSNTDLHVIGADLNEKATPITGFTTDFDGNTRSSSVPDIGADEYSPVNYSTALVGITSPTTGFCSGTKDITVTVSNRGISAVDSFTITYYIDGVLQSSKTYYATIAADNTADVKIGTISLSTTAQRLRAVITLPNGSTDPLRTDDTLTAALGSMGGTYSIGTGRDFANFTAAVNDLKERGLCSAVTFEVYDGTYTEQISIPEIAGASATNTITFVSKSADSSKAILQFASSATANYVVQLNGADYITFKELSLISTSTTVSNARVVDIKSGAHNNTFANNRIIGVVSTSTATTGVSALVFSGADKDTNNVFRANHFKYGTNALHLLGAATGRERGLLIENNIIDSTYHSQIYTDYQIAPVITGNTSNYSGSTTANGIYLSNVTGAAQVLRNNITSSILGYGIQVTTGNATSANRALIANNMISFGGTGGTAGIYLNNAQYFDVYYNSVWVRSTSTSVRALYVNSNTTTGTPAGVIGYNQIVNNIFANTGGGPAIEVTSNATATATNQIDVSDYNNIYATGTVLVKWGGTDYASLSTYQAASSLDANSVSVDPRFKSATDLHLRNTSGLNALGTPITAVTTDIDKETRSATPDIGADEFTPLANDLRVVSVIEPAPGTCGDSTTQVAVVVENIGTSSQSSLAVGALISGPSGNATLTQSSSTTIASEAIDTIYFTSTINTYNGGNFSFEAYTNLSTDANRSNDTLNTTIAINGIPAAPNATDTKVCGTGKATFTVTNAGTEIVNWFTSAGSTVPVASGNSFTTPSLTKDTTFYVSVGGEKKYTAGPKTNASVGTAGGGTASTYQMLFDANANLVIDSIYVNPTTTGNVIVNLTNSSNTLLATKTIAVTANTPTYLKLGFSVSKGTGYKLDASGSTASLYRNTSGASYPYSVPNVISITGNTFDPAYYYYFYDWNVTAAGCESPRKAVTAKVYPAVTGTNISKGATYNGTYNAGTVSNPDEVCPGKAISYEVKTPTGYTNSGYGTTWTFDYAVKTANGTASAATSRTAPSGSANGVVNFTPEFSLSDSTVILTVTVRNLATGCDTVMMRHIHISTAPKIAFSAADVCNGSAVTFVNNTTISSGKVSYKWYFGDGTTSADSAVTHTYAAAGTFTVSLVAANANGCRDSLAKSVTVHPIPTAGFTASNSCENIGISFTNTSTVSSGTLSYMWTFGDGTSSTAENPTKAFSGAGIYGVKLVVTGAGGCKDSVTKSITINATPQTGFTKGSVFNGIFNNGTASNPDVVCALYTISYNLTTPAGFSNADYGTTWDISQLSFRTAKGTAAADTTVTLPSSSSNGRIVFAPAFNTADSTFVLRATIRNKSTGCDTTIVRYVSVLSAPDADFSATNACAGEAVSFTDKSVIGGGTGAYKWYFGDAGNSTSTSRNPSFTYTTAGTYTVSLVVAVGSGCNDSITKTVTVYPRATPNFTFVSGCMDSAVVFTNTTSAGSATISGYTWNFGDGTTSTSTNPSKTFSAAGTYAVKLIVTTSNGCKDSVSKNVTVNPLPKPAFTFTSRCADSSITFTNTSTITSGTIASYLWRFGDGTTSTSSAPGKTYAAAGTYTVTLIATSNNGCKDSVKQTVTVYPKPKAGFTASTSCVGSAASFTNTSTIATGGTIASYLWRFGDGTTSTAANPAKTYAATGTYTVTLIARSARGCVDSVQNTITITPKPVPNFTFTNRCLDSTISFSNSSTIASGTIASYLWRFGDGTTSTSANPTKTYAAAGTYSVRLIATSTIGCKDSVSKTVTVYPKPVVKFSVSNTCVYNAASFTNQSTVSSGSIASYLWRFGDGTTSTLASPSKTYSAAGTYNVTLIVTTNNGCKDSLVTTGAVTIHPKPAASFTFVQRCLDSATSFTSTSTVASGLVTGYAWNFGDGGTSTSKDPNYIYQTAGTYTVKLVVTTNNGCKDSTTKTVTVYPKALVSIGMPTNACANDSVTFSNNSTIATGYSIIGQSWSFGDGGTSTAKNPSHKFAAAGKYNVTLTVTTSNGCVSSQTVAVTINAIPQTSFTATTVCETGTTVFTNTTVATSQGGLNYAWNFGDGGTSAAKTPTHKYAAGGDYNVRLIVTNASGCSDTMESTVRVNFKPVAAFTLPRGCAGQTLTFTDNSTIGGDSIANYAWTFGNLGTSNLKNPTFVFNNSGVYNVRLIVTSDKGCSDTVSGNITVFTVPLAGFTATTECEGGTTQFTNTFSSSIFTYKWMFGDGDSSTLENPAHTYAAAGTYNVIFTVTNNNGCATTVTKAVTVNAKPVADFALQNVCVGNAASFTNTSSVNGDSIISYEWNFGDGNTSTQMNPSHTYATAGIYNVFLRVATATCTDTISYGIVVYDKPVVSFTANDVCAGSATQFNNTTPSAAFLGNVWFFGNGDTSTAVNPTYTYATPGIYNVTLVVLNGNGCADSVSHQVRVNALPSLTVTHTTAERNVKFNVSDSSFTSFAWNFGDGGTSTAKNPTHRYPDTGRYNVTVVVTNASGCTATFTDTVNITTNSIKPANIAAGFNVDVYPNPFKEFTTLTYNLSKPATVRAAVYDMRGREVTVLVDNVQQMPGKYTQTIQPEQSQIRSGVYMLRVVVEGVPVTKQIIRVQ